MSHPLPVGHRTVAAGWKYSSGAIHAAFDYSAPIGTPIFAVKKGHILRVVDHIPNLARTADGESGDPPNYVLQAIMHNGERASVLYLHVSPGVPVHQDDPVADGQLIARTGHNGHSTGPHLHISVVKGWGAVDNPFRYLKGLSSSSPRPNGTAANGITIFPPRLVYSGAAQVLLAPNTVLMKDLKFGTKNSESVRRLQRRLNLLDLPNSVHLVQTGNYNARTKAEVQRWQVAKFHHAAGSPKANGNLMREQAKILFGDKVTVK